MAGGSPEHVPTEITRDRVSNLVAFGIKQEHICDMLGISDDTLRKHYKHELDYGLSNAIEKVANVLYSKAIDDRDLTAVQFFLKTRGRWREKDRDEGNKALEQYQSIVEKLLDKIK